MDSKVLKWITILTGMLTAVTCVCLSGFPNLHEQAVLAAEREQEIGNGRLVTASANPEEVIEEDGTLNAQMRIGLPPDLKKKELEIENDYITQTVYIKFDGGVDDYFAEYSIKGNCDNIESISYYKDGDKGVIALKLNKVYEIQHNYTSGSLYLSFLRPHDVYDKVVVIDAGHGSHAPGAVKLGIAEKDIDLAIVLKLKKMFENSSEKIGVYYTRTGDTNPTLNQRVQLANKADADLFISIHNNSDSAGNMTGVNGTQVMYSQSDASELSSKRLAEICLDNVSKSLGSTKRGLLAGDRIYIIRKSRVPVALIEVGFMTNYDELEKLSDDRYQKRAAKGIYHAVMKAFEEGY